MIAEVLPACTSLCGMLTALAEVGRSQRLVKTGRDSASAVSVFQNLEKTGRDPGSIATSKDSKWFTKCS